MMFSRNLARRLAPGLMAALLTGTVAHADEHWREHEFREHEFHDHRFLDERFHHNHYYPPPGFVFGVVPPGFNVVIHGGRRFYFAGGVWYRFDGPGRYVVVAPPVGVIVPAPPPYYTTVYANGAPYYYANNACYVQTPQGYMVVDPPPPNAVTELGPTAVAPPPPPPPSSGNVVELPPSNPPAAPPSNTVAQTGGDQLFIYPRQGQSPQQQAADRSQCHSWSVGEVGFDPEATSGGQSNPRYPDYKRAMTACLDAHGYTVR